MKKLFYTFFVFIFGCIPIGVFAALGDSGTPALSCQAILDVIPAAANGEYYLQSASMGSERKMYCNMTDSGGGWMLLFQRRGGSTNIESCGTHLNNFLQNSCGNTTSLVYGNSYSSDVDLTLTQFQHTEFLMVQENSSGVKDNDDNYVIKTTQNIFPNSDSGQNNFSIDGVCDVNGANCDVTDTKWIYVGTSWFNSSTCKEINYNGSTSLKGNYGYCHNGWGTYNANSLFGNRNAYSETKLWQHNNGAKNYMERVYVRRGNILPKDVIISNDQVPTGSATGTTVGILSATDDDGDPLTFSFASGIGDDDNGNFILSGATLSINLSPDADTKDYYTIRVAVNDGGGEFVEESFSIHITGGTYLGSILNPGSSCQAVRNARPFSVDGYYYLKTGAMVSARRMYCDMTRDDGGWMMLFQRRGGTNSVESCGTHLNNFLQNSCGSVDNINYSDSYSSDVDLTLGQFPVGEYLLTQENSSGVVDSDDAFIVHTSSNIFPNSDSGQNNFSLGKICNINNASCDTADTKWIYVGTSWFNSSLCLETNYSGGTTYKGNYGYCHNGWGSYGSNGLFGNRVQYSETKLWGYSSAGSYMERVYGRDILNDTTAPTISSFSPTSGSLSPSKSPDIQYNYYDSESGINTSSGSIVIQKWSGSVWGADISNTVITSSITTGTVADFETLFPSFGKYKIIFTVYDYVGNTQNQEHVLYVDEPEFIVSTANVDLGILNDISDSYSLSFTITVKTLGAGFQVYLDKNTDLLYSPFTSIGTMNSGIGYGYHPSPYASNLSPFLNPSGIIFSQGVSINTDGEKNTYTYDLRLGGKILQEQGAGDYEGSFDVRVVYGY